MYSFSIFQLKCESENEGENENENENKNKNKIALLSAPYQQILWQCAGVLIFDIFN
jgi:hypothetical protein